MVKAATTKAQGDLVFWLLDLKRQLVTERDKQYKVATYMSSTYSNKLHQLVLRVCETLSELGYYDRDLEDSAYRPGLLTQETQGV